jgi:LuxR family quorum sensing-dependent transcriptional regulator
MKNRHAYNLSDKEVEALSWLSVGKTHVEIAEILGVSRHAIRDRIIKAFDKIGAHNGTGAVGICLREGIIK